MIPTSPSCCAATSAPNRCACEGNRVSCSRTEGPPRPASRRLTGWSPRGPMDRRADRGRGDMENLLGCSPTHERGAAPRRFVLSITTLAKAVNRTPHQPAPPLQRPLLLGPHNRAARAELPHGSGGRAACSRTPTTPTLKSARSLSNPAPQKRRSPVSSEPGQGAGPSRCAQELLNHREGLCVFVDKPQVPIDNNKAERALRGPVIGRRLSFAFEQRGRRQVHGICYRVRGRPGETDGLVPGMDRADRGDLPAERGAAGALRPRSRTPDTGVRRAAGRVGSGGRPPVRGRRSGVGRPVGEGAQGQAAALASQPPRGVVRLRRQATGSDGQQQGRARAPGGQSSDDD